MTRQEFDYIVKNNKLVLFFTYQIAGKPFIEFYRNDLGGIFIYDTVGSTYVHVHYTTMEDVIKAFHEQGVGR